MGLIETTVFQVASIMAYQPIPAILDYACTKVWPLTQTAPLHKQAFFGQASHLGDTAQCCWLSVLCCGFDSTLWP